ncbi:glycosyltransferase family 39 protein [Nocardia altamirensis]|uniref:glycosyltransferase family 39 protein n=1 Tax=Nocardia altamirensis TaxID=472158 RepID=UPI000AEEC883|nr:glycosyltransferase family 39 protein [Nocardia altamirensis]
MTDLMKTQVPQEDISERPPFAVVGVGVVAVLSAIALLASVGRYGFFGDEMYFVAAGRRLAVSYADQGPVLPAIARLMDLLAPGSMVALRIPAVLVTVAAVVISAQIAREFGGSRRAQVLTAIAYATSPFLLVQGVLLATNTIDTALWVLISWLLIRWVRTRNDLLLLGAALATAVDMQVKWLIPFFWIAVAIGVLCFGPRELLRRPALWAGAALVFLVTLPSLIWQASHDWPQLRLGAVVAEEQALIGGRYTWLPLAIILAGLLGGALLIYGIVTLFRWEPLRPYRFLAPLPLLLAVAFLVTDGRPYYAAGCYAAIMAAGAVRWTDASVRWRTYLTIPVIVLSVAIVLFSLPWRPESDIAPAKDENEVGLALDVYGKFGWPELAESTATAYRAIPESERAGVVIVADSYWQAGALDMFREKYGLPAVYSPNRGFGYFGAPPDSATTVLWVGGKESDVRPLFGSMTPIGRADATLGFPGVTRDVTIWRCDRPVNPWSTTWSSLLRL